MSGHPNADLETLIAACVHCGLCLDTCPTFLETGQETESPRGRLLLAAGLESGRWPANPAVLGPLDRCLGCRACETVCPSGVRYGVVLETTRARFGTEAPRSRSERVLIRHLLWRGRLLGGLAAVYRGLGVHGAARFLSRGPWPGGVRRRLQLAPALESPAPRPPAAAPAPGAPAALLLRGCVARAAFPRTEQAMAHLLEAAGYAVTVLDEPPCCGALARHVGETATADALVERVRRALAGRRGILVPTAAGCGAHLLGEGSRALGDLEVRDLSIALEQGPRPLRFRPGPGGAVVYQDACHLRHGLGVTDPPRRLLRAAGAEVREPAEAEICCGSAGTYNLVHAAMAESLGRRKATVLEASGAPVVITANPGCAIQLGAYLGHARVETLARFLESRLEES